MNISKYIKEHEKYVETALPGAGEKDTRALKKYHRERIEYIQHERLVHLLVTLAVAVLVFLTLILSTIYTQLVVLIIFVLLLGLLIPYIFHYFFLENTVQQWYRLMDKIDSKLNKT